MNKRNQLVVLGVLILAGLAIGARVYVKNRAAALSLKPAVIAAPVVAQRSVASVEHPARVVTPTQHEVVPIPSMDKPAPTSPIDGRAKETEMNPIEKGQTAKSAEGGQFPRPVVKEPVQVSLLSADDVSALIREVAELRTQVVALTKNASQEEDERRAHLAELTKLRSENLQFRDALAAATTSSAGLLKQVEEFQSQSMANASQAKAMELVCRRTFSVNP